MLIAIIGGSGLDDRLMVRGLLEGPRSVEVTTPFGSPSAPITIGNLAGSDFSLAVLKRHDVGHTIPPHRVPCRANIFALKSLGVTHIIATGAVGSLREAIKPGELVLCDQLIDRTTGGGGGGGGGGAGNRARERTFFDNAAVHVEFADPCCPVMRAWLEDAAKSISYNVHATGTYVTIEGPSFSTRAESHMHRALGGDVVGMTALPEARLAREAEIAYALIALPTDFDSWMPRPAPSPGMSSHAGGAGGTGGAESLLAEIIGNLDRSANAATDLIEAALHNTAALSQSSPAHDALKLAIWTPKELIPKAEIERLRPIWGRWFPEGS